MSTERPKNEKPANEPKLPWVSPAIVDLPRLADLTLQTGAIPGSGSGGGTVF